MRRNQQRNFGSDWRRDMDDRREDRYPEDFEQRNFSGKDDSHRPYNRDFSRDFNSDMNRGSDFNRNMNSRYDQGMSGREHFSDRDYTRDYDLGTGTAMRMNRYEDQKEDRGFFGKGPKGWKRSDDRVKEEICECLYDSRMVDASEIEVQVKDGHVTLTGLVEGREAKREAERLVDGVRGVEDVQNNLRLNRNENVSEMRRSGSDTGKSASLS